MCANCHKIMDPIGLAMENFDAVGVAHARRRHDGTPIDASGELLDGTKVDGVSRCGRRCCSPRSSSAR